MPGKRVPLPKWIITSGNVKSMALTNGINSDTRWCQHSLTPIPISKINKVQMSDCKICFQRLSILPGSNNHFGTCSCDTAELNTNLLTILQLKVTVNSQWKNCIWRTTQILILAAGRCFECNKIYLIECHKTEV